MEKSLFDSKEKIDLGRKSFKERLLKSGKKTKIVLMLSLLLVSFFVSDIALGAKGLQITSKIAKVVLPPKVETKEEVKNEDVPYSVKRELDLSLGDDVVKVKQKGQKGTKEVKYRVTYTDGHETKREIKSELLSQSPTDEIVVFGSKTAFDSDSDSLSLGTSNYQLSDSSFNNSSDPSDYSYTPTVDTPTTNNTPANTVCSDYESLYNILTYKYNLAVADAKAGGTPCPLLGSGIPPETPFQCSTLPYGNYTQLQLVEMQYTYDLNSLKSKHPGCQ